MSGKELAGNDLFFGYLAEYIDGELPSNVSARYTEALKGNEPLVVKFQQTRGRFQVGLGEVVAPEPLKHKIRNLIQDDQIRATVEATEIQDIERSELWSNVRRRLALTLLVGAIVGGVVWLVMPRLQEKFNVIEYIGYEAVALEDDPQGRMNLPSTDLEEIKQFVGKIPGLKFKPQLLSSLKGWEPEGVSVIDYEVMKVVAVTYKSPERNGEHLHQFMIPGLVKDIPYKGEEADYRGIRYRVYASDKLNMLVWQLTPDMTCVLAGHRSAPELAELARSGTP